MEPCAIHFLGRLAGCVATGGEEAARRDAYFGPQNPIATRKMSAMGVNSSLDKLAKVLEVRHAHGWDGRGREPLREVFSRPAPFREGDQGENPMCRNIKPLFNFDPPATDEEIREASLQFVRKISGFHKPSRTNDAAFDRAVGEIAGAVRHMLDSLATSGAPRDREVEAARSRARAAQRFGTR